MNEFKKVGIGAGLFAAGSGVNYHFNAGQAQLHLAVAAAIVTMMIFAAEGIAQVVAYLATTAVELWVKVYHDARPARPGARDRRPAARPHDVRQGTCQTTMARRAAEKSPGLSGVPGRMGAKREEQRDRQE